MTLLLTAEYKNMFLRRSKDPKCIMNEYSISSLRSYQGVEVLEAVGGHLLEHEMAPAVVEDITTEGTDQRICHMRLTPK